MFSTYTLKYTKGVSGISHSQFDYDKVQILASKPIPMFGYGILHANLEAGKVLGTAPLIALAPTPANQSYSTAKNTFALLDYYDFITDTYINGYFEHHLMDFCSIEYRSYRKHALRASFLLDLLTEHSQKRIGQLI